MPSTLDRALKELAQRLSKSAKPLKITIVVEPVPATSNGHKRGTHKCAEPGCHLQVNGMRCRRHAQMHRLRERELEPGRFREPHQRAALQAGRYDACECGRPKLVSQKECDVCRELNKHRQAPGR